MRSLPSPSFCSLSCLPTLCRYLETFPTVYCDKAKHKAVRRMSCASCWPYCCLAPPLGLPARITLHRGINLCCSFFHILYIFVTATPAEPRGGKCCKCCQITDSSSLAQLHKYTVNGINKLSLPCLWLPLVQPLQN